LNYGADYKSFDRGFVSTTGAEFDAEREEGELWVERRLGAIFHIRGAVGETWEKPECADQAMLTRSASAALNFHQPNWGGSFISNYSLMEQGAGFVQETAAFTHAFLGSYRPSGVLSLSPNVSIKEERDPRTRVRIESPAAGLTVQYAPLLNLLMTGAASYSRSFGRNGAVDLRSLGAATAIDWKLGKSRGRDRSLSLNLKYNQQMDAVSSRNARDISTLLQWKVSGF
jgi:hypothetical protein